VTTELARGEDPLNTAPTTGELEVSIMATAFLTADVLQAKRRRLSHLEQRAARSGYETPPEVATEIEDLRSEIADAVVAPASEAERYAEVFEAIRELRRDIRQVYWLMPVLMVLLCGFLVLLVR
jgi:hypothetical protein